MPIDLGSVQETMLIPLSIRANETRRNNARLSDFKAVSITKAMDVDIYKYDKFMSHEGVVARTIMFDQEVEYYVKQFPTATFLNLGCGLDDRFSRVDNGKIMWYNIDLPDAIALRKNFFEPKRREVMVSSSVLDSDWLKRIIKRGKIIIIAEGLLMYFNTEEIIHLFHLLSSRFENYILITELMSSFFVENAKYHDTLRHTQAQIKWGTKNGHELTHLYPYLKLIKEESFNAVMRKYSLRGWLFSVLPIIKQVNNRLSIGKIM